MDINANALSVREIQNEDISHIINYWLSADDQYLVAMGVDLDKLPSEQEWKIFLTKQLALPIQEKQSFCIIWLLDGKAIGHSNINNIIYGKEAYMHLHIWEDAIRKNGLGVSWIKMTVPIFFNKYKLQDLFCEPYALNPAPNKSLERAGFKYVKSYISIPGSLNFEQEVNLWTMSKKDVID